MSRAAGLLTAFVLAVASIPVAPAFGGMTAAPTSLRYCGEAREMTANSVHASDSVSCSLARRLIKDLLGGSHACYPHGYTRHPHCYIAGFYCGHVRERSSGASEGECVRGRKRVVGVAGP
jgi:hypothetical protein